MGTTPTCFQSTHPPPCEPIESKLVLMDSQTQSVGSSDQKVVCFIEHPQTARTASSCFADNSFDRPVLLDPLGPKTSTMHKLSLSQLQGAN